MRLALLRYLMAVGPRTASACAEEVGASPTNISWHLRQLAKFGLVEVCASSNRRERPWRATQVGIDFGALSDDPVVRQAQDSLIAADLAEERQLTQRFLDHRDEVPPDWMAEVRLDTFVLRVSQEEVRRLNAALDDLLRPYVSTAREDAPDDARLVFVGLRLFPWMDATGTPQ
jgi:predicted ArsR family transcriptional regulator